MAPRPSNKAQRRRQLVEALLDLMAERGYDGTSVSEIAGRAGRNMQDGGFGPTGELTSFDEDLLRLHLLWMLKYGLIRRPRD